MTINKNVEKAINEQINAEFYSSYLYLSMAAYFNSLNLKGFGSWFELQAKEEIEHAMKFYNFVIERGGNITLKQIDAPKTEFKSVLEACEDAYNHELKVTSLINKLLEVAQAEKDYASVNFLQWYVNEQVEEEANTSEIVEWVKMTEGKKSSLMMVDHNMSKRAEND